MKRIKILIDDGLSSGSIGGISEHSRSLVKALQDNPTSTETGRRFEVKGKRPTIRHWIPGKFARLAYLAKLHLVTPWRHVGSRVDIVHFTNFYAPLWKLPSSRYVVTIHDLVIWENPELVPLPQWMIKALRKMSGIGVKRADAVTVLTDSSRERLIDLLGLNPAKVFVCPNIVKPIFEQKPSGKRDENLMILVGTISLRKNPATAIKAFAKIRDIFPDSKLVITGAKGDAQDQITRLIPSLGLSDRIEIIHGLNDRQLADLYKKAAMLITPSQYEGFGIPIIEAMASGLPVLASTIQVFEEVGGDAIEYFGNPTDVDALALKMESLLGDSNKRLQMSEAGFAEAVKYSASNVIGSYHKIYDDIYPA